MEKLKINFNNYNKGKGGNLKECIKIATGEIIIFFDSDLEYNVNVIPDILECFDKF